MCVVQKKNHGKFSLKHSLQMVEMFDRAIKMHFLQHNNKKKIILFFSALAHQLISYQNGILHTYNRVIDFSKSQLMQTITVMLHLKFSVEYLLTKEMSKCFPSFVFFLNVEIQERMGIK